jgi:hypothetical protein
MTGRWPSNCTCPTCPRCPISLGVRRRPAGPPRGARRSPGTCGCCDALSSYLPLLLMALLALGTWWLVKNTPGRGAGAGRRRRSHEPDYTMKASPSALRARRPAALRIEGRELRHYPDTDRIEIDGVRIRAWAPDGRVTVATARGAWPTATAARCSCRRRRGRSSDAARRPPLECAASSCTPSSRRARALAPAGAGAHGGDRAAAPAAWSTTTGARARAAAGRCALSAGPPRRAPGARW